MFSIYDFVCSYIAKKSFFFKINKLTVVVSFVDILTPDVLHTRRLTALTAPARAAGAQKLSPCLRARGVVATRPLRSAHVHQVLRNK